MEETESDLDDVTRVIRVACTHHALRMCSIQLDVQRIVCQTLLSPSSHNKQQKILRCSSLDHKLV